jgi:hypothetical protein
MRRTCHSRQESAFRTSMAKYGVKWAKTPGKLALTTLKIIFLTAPLSRDWRSFTSKIRQKQRQRIDRMSRRRPTPQSGQEILANINEQCLSGTLISVPLVSLIFLNEQNRFSRETFGAAMPSAMSEMALRSS